MNMTYYLGGRKRSVNDLICRNKGWRNTSSRIEASKTWNNDDRFLFRKRANGSGRNKVRNKAVSDGQKVLLGNKTKTIK